MAEQAEARHRTAMSLGAIGAAFLASLCCIGPVLFVTLGVGAGLASRFEPLRPFFTFLTVALLAAGFYTVYGRKGAAISDEVSASTAGAVSAEADEAGASCTVPRDRKRDKVLLWVATLIVVVLLTFPQWSLWFV